MSAKKVYRAYWFEPADGVLGYGDGRKPEIGTTHTVKCAPVLCEAGLHGSLKALDALRYAASNRLWLVEISGCVKGGADKVTGKSRKYLAVADVELILREFACHCALDVANLWDMPQIVREYLETGDESKRDAAWDAASDAASDAAWDAARAAAWAAAWAAARDAARDAAWAAAGDAAWAAASDAASDAARAAASDAARDAQYKKLEAALERVFGGVK